jgi:DNA-binding winged helix-turn-helix (wHTH) protein
MLRSQQPDWVLAVILCHLDVSKEELLRSIWPDSFVEEGNLTQYISVLRKVMAPDFAQGSPIETIPRVGYRFSAEVRAEITEPHGITDPSIAGPAPVPELPAPSPASPLPD